MLISVSGPQAGCLDQPTGSHGFRRAGSWSRLDEGSGWRVSTHRIWPIGGGLAADRAPAGREETKPLLGW